MSVRHYERIQLQGYRRGRCARCGNSAERSVTFEQTVNPWNRHPDGRPRTRAEVYAAVDAQRRAWYDGPLYHARCEATP